MKRLLAVTLLGACLAAPAAAQENWRDSLTVLSAQIARAPRSTDLRLRKAAVNVELGQWDYAIEEYGRVLDIEPQNPAALYFRAYAHTHQNHLDMARRDYEQFLMLAPRHFEGRLGLAQVLRKMGRRQDTTDQLNLLVEQHPDSALAFVARAAYETEQQQYDLALFDWDRAIALQPTNAEFVASKTDLLLQLKRNAEAWAELEEAMKRGIARNRLKPWIDRCR
ncbi:MAG: tetratricopeptide repeat protein [Prevotella sp.]|nr:tetratricopeptide repeat protein [Prevotella sp.]